jgi:hypothetical protein
MRSLALIAALPMLMQSCEKDTDTGSDLPSGFRHSLFETREDTTPDGKRVLRLRYVDPNLTSDDHQRVAEDFAALCARDALPKQAAADMAFDQAVISLANKKSEFGVFNPDVTQYFEAFTLENDRCIWEAF